MACCAGIIPAVLGTTGQVLDLGRERRLFTGAARRALILRDRGCAFPGCDRPPKWTEGHHILHVRREALVVRAEVRDLRRRVIAVAG
jgi:hypothetical protein